MTSHSTSGMDQLLSRWMDDAEFRDTYAADAEAAVRAGGFDLTNEELATLQSNNWNLSDGALAERANKPRVRGF